MQKEVEKRKRREEKRREEGKERNLFVGILTKRALSEMYKDVFVISGTIGIVFRVSEAPADCRCIRFHKGTEFEQSQTRSCIYIPHTTCILLLFLLFRFFFHNQAGCSLQLFNAFNQPDPLRSAFTVQLTSIRIRKYRFSNEKRNPTEDLYFFIFQEMEIILINTRINTLYPHS